MIKPEIREVDQTEKEAIAECLGVKGIGSYVMDKAVSDEYLASLPDLSIIPWRDNHSTFENKRELTVIQQHDVYALKLLVGDQAVVAQSQFMRDIANEVERFVQGLSSEFPVLSDWRADEVSMHRYDQEDIGLSRHRDNLRFWGLVVVLTLQGSSDFVIYDGEAEHVSTVRPGSLALMRATNLIGNPSDKARQTTLCPEHGVVRVRELPRTSLIVRDNLRPLEEIEGFVYANWEPTAP